MLLLATSSVLIPETVSRYGSDAKSNIFWIVSYSKAQYNPELLHQISDVNTQNVSNTDQQKHRTDMHKMWQKEPEHET